MAHPVGLNSNVSRNSAQPFAMCMALSISSTGHLKDPFNQTLRSAKSSDHLAEHLMTVAAETVIHSAILITPAENTEFIYTYRYKNSRFKMRSLGRKMNAIEAELKPLATSQLNHVPQLRTILRCTN